MKKIIVFLFIVLNLFSCNQKAKQITFLGYNLDGYVTYLKSNNTNINDNFVMQKGYISYLYSMVAKDAKSLLDNQRLSDNIKRSNIIYIQIGNDDFNRCINKEEQIIDQEIFITQKELFSYYYFLLLEEIRLIYEKEIIILSPYYKFLNSEIDIALNEFFELGNEAARYFDCKYIDIREINVFIKEDNVLNEEAYSYLNKLIGL